MNQTKHTIFYSWQSDNKRTKKFIEKCLKNAIKTLANDAKLSLRPDLDDSTKGKMGAVDIPATIMKKIDNCDAFVADLSIVGECNKRKLVNQNVLYELGYMIGKRTETRVVMLFNSDSGEIRDLPFDISHRRVVPFSMQKDEDGKQLTSCLANIISAYLQNVDLQKRLPEDRKIELDEEELDIMKLFATIDDDKCVLVIRTLDGAIIQPVGACDDLLLKELIEKQGENKLIANLDDLVRLDVLSLKYSDKGTPNYRLTKLGYTIIEGLGKIGAGLKEGNI